MDALLRLFKAIEVKSKIITKTDIPSVTAMTIKNGFIFAPEVISNFSEKELIDICNVVKDSIGITSEQLNNSFHKSWAKVQDADIVQLVVEQILHYITVYIKDISNIDAVYISSEKLDIPEITDDINLILIHGYTYNEIKTKLLSLVSSDIALHEDTVKDIKSLINYFDIDDISFIKNKEVYASFADHFGYIPENPVEFLRYVIFKLTGNTLLIKNWRLIAEIQMAENAEEIYKLFMDYDNKYGFKRLAEIFLRFKPLFLAFKVHDCFKPVINKLRRLAVKYHKTVPVDYLNSITHRIKHELDINHLHKELKKASIFRKIKLAYALKYRTLDMDSIIYRVRNGKGYATEFNFERKDVAYKAFNIVYQSIINDLKKKVSGKTIYIPDNIVYALPSTEKQFTGIFPSGSYIRIKKDMIIGINWWNTDSRVDLDLALMDVEANKYGWDGEYRTDDGSILFSGDITDGGDGATELFYIRKPAFYNYLVTVNDYTMHSQYIPFKIIIAENKINNLYKNYTVNPNNVKAIVNSKINKNEKIIGMVSTSPDECRFYFIGTEFASNYTVKGYDYVIQSLKYIFNFYQNSINLNTVLKEAGAEITNYKGDINLSPEVISKDSIINLIKT